MGAAIPSRKTKMRIFFLCFRAPSGFPLVFHWCSRGNPKETGRLLQQQQRGTGLTVGRGSYLKVGLLAGLLVSDWADIFYPRLLIGRILFIRSRFQLFFVGKKRNERLPTRGRTR